MYDGLLVIDADSHKMENPVVFFDYLEAPYRDRLLSRTDRWGQQRLVIRDFNPATGRLTVTARWNRSAYPPARTASGHSCTAARPAPPST